MDNIKSKKIWNKRKKIQTMKKIPESRLMELNIIINDPIKFPLCTLLPYLKKKKYWKLDQWIFFLI
jgi:hypothetical protein